MQTAEDAARSACTRTAADTIPPACGNVPANVTVRIPLAKHSGKLMDPLKILLVDDSKSARYALRLQLQRHGVSVETADSAESALQQIEKQPPDAVLMDHTMPGMNGFEALEILKANQATAGIPVVMCTSHEEPTYDKQARNKGALDVLPKSGAPQKLPEVLDEIRAVLTTTRMSAAPKTSEAGEPLAVSAATLLPGTSETETTPPPSPATTEGLSKQAIETLIDIRVDAQLERIERQLDVRVDSILEAMLGTRLDQTLPGRLDHSLEPRLAQQKQDLTRELTAMLDERVVARLAAERDQADSQAEEIGRERIQRATTELLDERLPGMIEQQIGAQSAMIMHLVERQVREIEEARNTDPALLKRLIAEIDPIIDARATEIAKQEVQTAVDEAVQGLAAADEAMTSREKPPTTGANLSAIGAAAVGVIAAAIVYFMLS